MHITLYTILLAAICAVLSCRSAKQSAVVASSTCVLDSSSQVNKTDFNLQIVENHKYFIIDSPEILMPSAVLPHFDGYVPDVVIRARRIALGSAENSIQTHLSNSLAATDLSSRCEDQSDSQTESEQSAVYEPPNQWLLGVVCILFTIIIMAIVIAIIKFKH